VARCLHVVLRPGRWRGRARCRRRKSRIRKRPWAARSHDPSAGRLRRHSGGTAVALLRCQLAA